MNDREDPRVERLADVLDGMFDYLELNGILWHVIRHADDNTGARLLCEAARNARGRSPSNELLSVDAGKPWTLLPPNPEDVEDPPI